MVDPTPATREAPARCRRFAAVVLLLCIAGMSSASGQGLASDGVSLVVHVDPPNDSKDYVHRAGRTARAGEQGTVVTLVLPRQRRSTFTMLERAGVTAERTVVTADAPELAEVTGARKPSGVPVPLPQDAPPREHRPRPSGPREYRSRDSRPTEGHPHDHSARDHSAREHRPRVEHGTRPSTRQPARGRDGERRQFGGSTGGHRDGAPRR